MLNPRDRRLDLGMWNVTSLTGKVPKLVLEVEQYQIDIVGLTSIHSYIHKYIHYSWRAAGLSFSGVSQGGISAGGSSHSNDGRQQFTWSSWSLWVVSPWDSIVLQGDSDDPMGIIACPILTISFVPLQNTSFTVLPLASTFF